MQWMHLCLLATALTAAEAFSGTGILTTNTHHHHAIKSQQSANKAREFHNDGHWRSNKSCCNAGRFSTQLNAAGSNDDSDNSSSGNKKSIFEQAFKLPWDDDDDATGADSSKAQSSQKQQQWQWWPNSSESSQSQESSSSKASSTQQQAKQPPRSNQQRSRKPQRVPRYPSALQESPPSKTTNISTPDVNKSDVEPVNKSDVDKYVQSAEGAAKSMTTVNNDKNKSIANDNETTKGGAKIQNDSHGKEPRQPKLGILLIDHGSKRQASNDNLHSIAASYQSTWDEIITANNNFDGNNTAVIVRAAHMEIASPSILTTLRQLVLEDEITQAVCVPYFLSPGKHATVDVPQLINEARDALEKEGLLDYNDGRVEILSSKVLGSNIESMLKVVDGLVRNTLEEEGGGLDILQLPRSPDDDLVNGSGSSITSNEINDSINQEEAKEELRKYTNRATLLENMLETKVKQLKTMSNRVTLMEDALTRLKDKSKKELEENGRQRDGEEREFAAQVATLTDIIASMCQEKEAFEKDTETLALQQMEMEEEYNATVVDLTTKLSASEEELQQLRDNIGLEQQQNEDQTNNLVDERLQKIQQQQQQIQELQTQLADLLDAHNELEQLQNDAEATMLRYREQLKDSREGYESSLEMEQEEKERNRVKWIDSQRQLEEDGEGLRQMLDESTSKYEALLDEERVRADEWEGKWVTLKDEQTSMGNNTMSENNSTDEIVDPSAVAAAAAATKTDAEWTILQKELEEITSAKANATNKLQQLELQLEQQNQPQQQQHESTSTAQKEEQQQQQLQEYLRNQLSEYYETIQDQTSQISLLEKTMDDTECRHEESMLIATNAVEASQRREENLLTNIEELESELAIVKKEKDEGEERWNELQVRLDARMEEDAAAAAAATIPNEKDGSSSDKRENLAQHNNELTMIIESLQDRVQAVSQEKERIMSDKRMMEDEIRRLYFVPRRVRDMIDITSSSVDDDVVAKGEEPKKRRRGRKWVRGILRPWTLLRKRRAEERDD